MNPLVRQLDGWSVITSLKGGKIHFNALVKFSTAFKKQNFISYFWKYAYKRKLFITWIFIIELFFVFQPHKQGNFTSYYNTFLEGLIDLENNPLDCSCDVKWIIIDLGVKFT